MTTSTTINVAYARFNIKLAAKDTTAQAIAELQELLYGSAIWGGAEDVEVFLSESNSVIGVSIPLEEDLASILEAGSVLGICQRTWEESSVAKGSSWLSIVTANGEVLYSPLGF